MASLHRATTMGSMADPSRRWALTTIRAMRPLDHGGSTALMIPRSSPLAGGLRHDGRSAHPRPASRTTSTSSPLTYRPLAAAVGTPAVGTTSAHRLSPPPPKFAPRSSRTGAGAAGAAAGMSSLAGRIWDVVRTGRLNPANPVVVDVGRLLGLLVSNSPTSGSGSSSDSGDDDEYDDEGPAPFLPNFVSIRPHHLEEAARTVRAEYDESLANLERRIESALDAGEGALKYDDVVPELERISLPMLYVHRVAGVLSTLAKSDEMTDIASGAIAERLELQHGRSDVLAGALEGIRERLLAAARCDSLDDDDDAKPADVEKLRAVTRLLLDAQLSGQRLHGDQRRAHDEIQSRVEEAELDLIDLSNGERTSPMESIALMYTILGLKAERSKLLGYNSYADWSLQRTVAPNVESVRALHGAIASRAVPALQDHLEISSDDDPGSSDDLRVYFDLDSVLDGLFNLSTALFGIIITESADGGGAWHDDVRLFHVADAESGHRIASFYLDPFKRQDKVRNNECMLPLIDRRYDQILPLICLSCNVRTPVWAEDPAYLTLDDVVALFHEFGHGLQHMMPKVELGSLSGAHRMEEDVSEFVSQFMEYWLFEDLFLPVIAKHARTGEPIPPEEIAKIQRNRRVRKQRELLHRLALGELEMELNDGFDPRGEESIVAVQRRVAERYLPPFDWPAKADIALLQQVFEGNARGKYTARYRYLWSEIYSADAFAAFKDAGFENEGEMKRVGKVFRRTILEAGSAVPPDEAFKRFRGREASPEALLKLYDI